MLCAITLYDLSKRQQHNWNKVVWLAQIKVDSTERRYGASSVRLRPDSV